MEFGVCWRSEVEMSNEVDLPVTAANVCKAGNAPRPQLPCGRHADTDCPWWQCCAWAQREQ